MLDHSAHATERRERWILAIFAALAVQAFAIAGAVVVFGVAVNDHMNDGDIADAVFFVLLGACACVFALSGWLVARISQSLFGWIVLVSPLLVWLAAQLITKTS